MTNEEAPRLVVKFNYEGDKEHYTYGIFGRLPIQVLVGCIVRVQAELAFRHPEECDETQLEILWDTNTKRFSWRVHLSVHIDSMVGMLETIKVMLVGNQMAEMAQQAAVAQQTGLIGSDGRPILKRG